MGGLRQSLSKAIPQRSWSSRISSGVPHCPPRVSIDVNGCFLISQQHFGLRRLAHDGVACHRKVICGFEFGLTGGWHVIFTQVPPIGAFRVMLKRQSLTRCDVRFVCFTLFVVKPTTTNRTNQLKGIAGGLRNCVLWRGTHTPRRTSLRIALARGSSCSVHR